MSEKIVISDSFEQTTKIFGAFDENVRIVERAFGVSISNRASNEGSGDAIIVSGAKGEDVNSACRALEHLKKLSKLEEEISSQTVEYVVSMVSSGAEEELGDYSDDCICITTRGRPIKAKTVGQKRYVDTIKKNTVVLCIGPAGTGKTFLAVAMAVKALRNKEINRIILTRPAVEAGEKLGYLPGDLQNKIDPYLRPLYDALYEMVGNENFARYVEKGTIEIAPLAYMRGRTLDDSFIILDEAQNTTPEQMKMFLTRLGFNSKAIVTGDITQTDLGPRQKSGLVEAVKILDGVEDIAIHHFTDRDVVRHKLVQRIILAYDKYEKSQAAKKEDSRHFKFKPTERKPQ